MQLGRNLLSLVFWALAILSAWPAVQQLVPIGSSWIAHLRGIETVRPAFDSAALYSSLQGQVPWLVLAGVFVANATLLRMLNAVSKI